MIKLEREREREGGRERDCWEKKRHKGDDMRYNYIDIERERDGDRM